MRHILGEDLNVGCVCRGDRAGTRRSSIFEGKAHALSKPNYLMRYDVEVSGFPSSHAGHLCLLRLTEDDYPGTTERPEEWPSWRMPVPMVSSSHGRQPQRLGLRSGLRRIAGVGRLAAGRAAATAARLRHASVRRHRRQRVRRHRRARRVRFHLGRRYAVVWELNVWYHTLNCGLCARISGETDFPCIYGDNVGLGRIYVRLDKLNYEDWCEGIREGRSYVSDGTSHLMDFRIDDRHVGVDGSELRLQRPGTVRVRAVAARLDERPDPVIRNRRGDEKPYWHFERARIGQTDARCRSSSSSMAAAGGH